MSFAGKTHYDVGTRVRIKGITDPNDIDLNGREGALCHPRRDQRPIQDVGVRLDPNGRGIDEMINIYRNEFEVIRGEKR